MKLIRSFWQKAWWGKLIIFVVGLFIFFTAISILSPKGQKSFKEGLTPTPTETPKTTPTPTVTPSPTPRKLPYELTKSYQVGDEIWRTLIIPKDTTLEELTNVAQEVHQKYPDIYFNIFDDKREFEAYKKWQISRNDPDVYFPEEWVKEHGVGLINRMLTPSGARWQLYFTPSDFWGNSTPSAVDLE